MNRRTFIGSSLSTLAYAAGARAATKKHGTPNIVLLYIDDWAWCGTPIAMDTAEKNSRLPGIRMPHLETLAGEGMTFSNAYGSPQCSPARACVQTGQSSPRNGFTVYMRSKGDYYDTRRKYAQFPVVPNISDMHLDEDAVTIAEALKPRGYVSAHVGKWHMRGDPGKRGYAVHDGDTTNTPGNTLTAGLKKGEKRPRRIPRDMKDPKLMFSITEKAIDFMEEQAGKGTPFYLQVSHYAMHAGRECLYETREKWAKHPLVQAWYRQHDTTADTVRRKQDPAVWLGMAEDLDGRIGAVLEKLRELGIEDNTYIVVVADNGYRHHVIPGFTQPLHGHKWWLWEGGVRVPMIVRGPGIAAGSRFSANVANYDFLPTFYEWAGGNPDDLKNIDGVSLADYMAGKKKPDSAFRNRALYFHYPHYRTSMPHSSIIAGRYKVLHFYEQPAVRMLFDLSKDIGEVNNIAQRHPAVHRRLYDDMMAYLKEVGARFPKKNPDYDPAAYRKAKNADLRAAWGPFEGERALEDDEK